MTQNPPKKTRGPQKRSKEERSEIIAQYALERAKGTTKKKAAQKIGISRRQAYHLENSAPDLLKQLITNAGQTLAQNGLEKATAVITDTLNETLEQGVKGVITYQKDITDNQGETTGEKETAYLYDPDLHKAQLNLRKLGITAAEDVLKATGILNTPTAAPVIEHLTVQQTNVLLPAVRNILTALSMDVLEDKEADNPSRK